MIRHAVISGAGIAGPALAHQLAARGWRTTVLERFPQRRGEGQNVDVRGPAKEVARRMGVLEAIRAANTGEVGMRFVGEDGSPVASFPMNGPGQIDGPTAELEILRGELSRVLIEHSAADVDYRFGATIADLTDHGEHVTVTLDDETVIDADLVVIAEGLRSRTRRFVTDAQVSDLGMYIAYLTIARQDTDDRWWNWQPLTGSRSVHLRPDNLGTTRAMLTFLSGVRGLEVLDRADQITILRRTFADAGGAVPRILAGLDDSAFYFDAVGKFRAPHWSKGRITLLGDAAFCNATFGGVGTSMALIGAYVLAGELSGTDDVCTALARYERFMRGYAELAPQVSIKTLRRANPATPTGIRVLHAGARLAAGPVGRAATKLFGNRWAHADADDIRLPDYPEMSSA